MFSLPIVAKNLFQLKVISRRLEGKVLQTTFLSS